MMRKWLAGWPQGLWRSASWREDGLARPNRQAHGEATKDGNQARSLGSGFTRHWVVIFSSQPIRIKVHQAHSAHWVRSLEFHSTIDNQKRELACLLHLFQSKSVADLLRRS